MFIFLRGPFCIVVWGVVMFVCCFKIRFKLDSSSLHLIYIWVIRWLENIFWFHDFFWKVGFIKRQSEEFAFLTVFFLHERK